MINLKQCLVALPGLRSYTGTHSPTWTYGIMFFYLTSCRLQVQILLVKCFILHSPPVQIRATGTLESLVLANNLMLKLENQPKI